MSEWVEAYCVHTGDEAGPEQSKWAILEADSYHTKFKGIGTIDACGFILTIISL